MFQQSLPMHYATASWCPDLVRLLLEEGGSATLQTKVCSLVSTLLLTDQPIGCIGGKSD